MDHQQSQQTGRKEPETYRIVIVSPHECHAADLADVMNILDMGPELGGVVEKDIASSAVIVHFTQMREELLMAGKVSRDRTLAAEVMALRRHEMGCLCLNIDKNAFAVPAPLVQVHAVVSQCFKSVESMTADLANVMSAVIGHVRSNWDVMIRRGQTMLLQAGHGNEGRMAEPAREKGMSKLGERIKCHYEDGETDE